MTFVAKEPLNIGRPTNLSLTAALLRTNRQIQSEARSILYSENHFIIGKRFKYSKNCLDTNAMELQSAAQ